jgi:hypothetical protein
MSDLPFKPLPPRVRFAYAVGLLTPLMWAEHEGDPEVLNLLGLQHFGLAVLWGFVDEDPHGQLWPVTEPRPVVGGWQAIHVGVC